MENILPLSTVNLSLEEYEDFKQQISDLKVENNKLKAEKEELCEKNKVRIIRKEITVSRPVPFWNPSMLSTVEATHDELINFEDVKESIKLEIEDKISKDLNSANTEIKRLRERYELLNDAYDNLLEAYISLKHRNLWNRIINKID